MGVCGKYAKHSWTCALRFKDRVCVRCGLSVWDRDEALFELPKAKASLSNAKTPKNRISPLKQVGVKRLLGRQFWAALDQDVFVGHQSRSSGWIGHAFSTQKLTSG
jgi:hypothetical protein